MPTVKDHTDAVRALNDLLECCDELKASIETYGDRVHTKTDWFERFLTASKNARQVLRTRAARGVEL